MQLPLSGSLNSEATRLELGQLGFSAHIGVILGREWRHFIAGEKSLNRLAERRHRVRSIAQHLAEFAAKICSVFCRCDLLRDLGQIAIVHFVWVEQRLFHELGDGVGPAIPEKTAEWRGLNIIVALVKIEARHYLRYSTEGALRLAKCLGRLPRGTPMGEPWLPEKPRAGACQLAQLVPAGSESVESKKIALPSAICDRFGGAAVTWGAPTIDATSGMAAASALVRGDSPIRLMQEAGVRA